MVNERLHADMMTMLEGLDEQMRGIADVQLKRSKLTATASTCEARITVTVNADGLLIQTVFADDIADLTFDEIAEGMTEAVQKAAQEVDRLSQELLAPLRERKSQLPKLSDIIEGAPDLGARMPVAPPPPTSMREFDSRAAGVFDGTVSRSMISDD
ncbi:YbaB/EbfC family DNA-binding protein [Nocardia sp. NBC_01377]|uniref:YbaB/EbfC family DNA-binding protein n=1 Tax=Nocardia sp. NBC_01377 TaxID=2903595 RepID=UPI00324FD854